MLLSALSVKCLVTGATGLVGSAIAARLLRDGAEVHALVREESERSALSEQGAKIFIGDLSDPTPIAQAAERCDVVVHAAGTSSPTASGRALGWVHVAGTENVLTAAAYAECKRFVHISCADVTLVNAPRSFWDEEAAPTEAPYGAFAKSKLAAEEIVRVTRTSTMSTTVVRPALVWGAGDLTRLPLWCSWANEGRLRLVGTGKHFMATTHAENLAQGVSCVIERSPPSGRVFYIVDRETPLCRDFVTLVCQSAGVPPPRQGQSRTTELVLAHVRQWLHRAGPSAVEVVQWSNSTSFNGSRARDELGYEPVIDQATGMKRLADWIKEQGGAQGVITKQRPPLTDHDVSAQAKLAGASPSTST